MWKLLAQVFGSRNQRLIKELSRTVAATNALETSIGALTDEQFPEKTRELKARFAAGTPLDDLVPEAFALVRESSRRKLGLRHFDVQLIGGLALHSGKIAEMRTGEGKTLMSTLPAYLNALSGDGVHVVTVNEYLAQRDSEWMGPVFRFLGLEVGVIKNAQSPDEKRAAYACDITYGTNNEFGFDYLRDNLAFRLEDRVQRKLSFAIVDEVDSILIDEARTPLIISGPAEESTELYIKINALIPRLTRALSEEIVDRGVLVNFARMAGNFRIDDVILSANGSNVRSGDDILAVINASKAPQKAKFEVWRDRAVHTIMLDTAKAAAAGRGEGEQHPEGASKLLDAVGISAKRLLPQKRYELAVDGDFWVDEKQKQATLTEAGHQRVEELFFESGLLREGESLYDPTNIRLMHHLNAALRAHSLYKRDVEYIVRGGEVIIVDEFTGRTMQGRRWSDGLHQAVEAKEGVKVREENQTVASITFQNYFRLYSKLSGMTGTADTEAFEFQQIYGLEVVVIPTHKPMIRKDRSDLVFLSETDKFQAILEDIQDCVTRGQPALVGTTSIETSERLAKLLVGAKIPHEVLNAKQHEREAHIVAEAGRPGAVTIATNMAGRGTDIVLGGSPQTQIDAIENPNEAELKKIHEDWKARHEQVVAAGGLHIVGTERHESRRIDNQLRGRSGRQGDPGSSRFYLSLEDNLMRIFGDPTRMKALMTRVGMKAGEAIESGMLTRQIEKAQRKVEAHNFDIRKQLLLFDDVANDQRKVVYQQRTEIMGTEDLSAAVHGIREEALNNLVDQYLPKSASPSDWDLAGLKDAVQKDFNAEVDPAAWLATEPELEEAQLRRRIVDAAHAAYEQRIARNGAEVMRHVEKQIMMNMLDQHWREHLAAMDYLRQGIHLRGYAQKDYRFEYKREAFELFAAMLERVKFETVTVLANVQVRTQESIDQEEEERRQRLMRAFQAQHAEAHSPLAAAGLAPPDAPGVRALPGIGAAAPAGAPRGPPPLPVQEPVSTFVRVERKIGRNEPCPCGSGKKYKRCCGGATVN